MTKILDCTLRDGIHINNFSDECILSTIDAGINSNIDYIEVGYRFPECITVKSGNLVVMVDSKNIQPVNLNANYIRVACYPQQINTALNAVENYKSQGFKVFLHLMTADKFEDWDLLKNWENKDIIESLYFADSFGSFMPEDVERIYQKILDCGFEKISFHAHNNLQLAFANTIKAIQLGAYSVDASAYGMGRGGGNLPIELLLHYLKKDNKYYLELIQNYYLGMFKKNNWGYNFESLISGLKNIHP